MENGNKMKLFKKALLATAIVGTMGAQAATISSTPLNLSAEGAALKVLPTVKDVIFDVVVDKDHPSSSVITINFDKNVDLNELVGGAVEQTVGGGTSWAGDVGFNYGTGSFTFDDVKVFDRDQSKGETDAISFKVNLGNPLTANSAFRVTLGQHGLDVNSAGDDLGIAKTRVLIGGESSISYISNKADGTLIETGVGELAQEISQFDFKITEPLDATISRTDGTAWSYTGFEEGIERDELEYELKNDETLGLAVLGADVRVKFTGNFANVDLFEAVEYVVLESDAAKATIPQGALEPFYNESEIAGDPVTGVALSYESLTGLKTTVKEQVVFNNSDGISDNDVNDKAEIPVTGDVKTRVSIYKADNNGVSLGTDGYTLFNNVDAGKWTIDATIINVPYVPVNAANTQTFIHFANEAEYAVDVIATAIDNYGVVYGPLNLGNKLPANTVVKFSEPEIDALFGLKGATTKLSITFNVDAREREVVVYAVSQNDNGRTEISTSQQRND